MKKMPALETLPAQARSPKVGEYFLQRLPPPKAIFGPSSVAKVIPAPIKLSARTPLIEDAVIPIVVPPTSADKGKGIQDELVRTSAQPLVIPETSKKEMEEILKIIKKSDYDVVEQLGQTPSKISMLDLLLCSEAHAIALIRFLKTAHVPQETSADQFQDCVASLTADNGLGFSDADLTPKGRKHSQNHVCHQEVTKF